ncbi:hypothetical protein [Pedosphaera parvula]|uniref:Uncharacterized protein n=1 Tax=Pedosphaera parvula (strain Ellin514) TaxID=320771 RepID=B9XNU0_PEDPL|nr:hypothetical protein [Pedosphaera parvula]EEF58513.1 hypothetical protein Cflav_PD1240 [Pedosphaera parvula Ellin514]
MEKIFHIKIGANDLGQLLDGLEIRASGWENTAEFLRSGEMPEEFFIAEECSDADEAEKIGRHYRSIVEKIRGQIEEQGGWS